MPISLNWHCKVWYRPRNFLYLCLRESRISNKEKYGIAMTLELIPVEPHIIILSINYVPHLLLTFAIYRTGNRM